MFFSFLLHFVSCGEFRINNNNNNKENARDTTYFTTRCLQTDMALTWHIATSAFKTIIL